MVPSERRSQKWRQSPKIAIGPKTVVPKDANIGYEVAAMHGEDETRGEKTSRTKESSAVTERTTLLRFYVTAVSLKSRREHGQVRSGRSARRKYARREGRRGRGERRRRRCVSTGQNHGVSGRPAKICVPSAGASSRQRGKAAAAARERLSGAMCTKVESRQEGPPPPHGSGLLVSSHTRKLSLLAPVGGGGKEKSPRKAIIRPSEETSPYVVNTSCSRSWDVEERGEAL